MVFVPAFSGTASVCVAQVSQLPVLASGTWRTLAPLT